MKQLIVLLGFAGILVSCSPKSESQPKVKNVILLIGDGMGTSQIFAGITANKGQLNLERAQYVGFSKTQSASHYTTDSGAGGTAISTGSKTNNGTIGMDTAGKPLPNMIELSEAKGLSTGLVATSSITHATPASFIAHQLSRNDEPEIARQFPGSGIDIFIGGGHSYFADSMNVIQQLLNNGYRMVNQVSDIDPDDSLPIGCLAADIALPTALEGRGDYLLQATKKAMAKLAHNPAGFFLMVEGSQIDWAGHSNDIQYLTSEMIDFDQAVGAAFDFADSHPGTLVIVTADHETGGLSLPNGNLSEGTLEAKFSTDYHTGVMVPVFAYGTGANCFAGIYQNTGIFDRMVEALQLHETP